MLRSLIVIITLFYSTLSFSQIINKKILDKKGTEKLVGNINREGLTQAPFNDWFSKNHDNYLVNDKVISKLKNTLKGYEITVFLGTWCGDSKREVPRFFNVLEAAGFPAAYIDNLQITHHTFQSSIHPWC